MKRSDLIAGVSGAVFGVALHIAGIAVYQWQFWMLFLLFGLHGAVMFFYGSEE